MTPRRQTPNPDDVITILLCDTEWHYRDAIVSHLEGMKEFTVVTPADAPGDVDVAFLDLDATDGTDPETAVQELRQQHPRVAVVAFTSSQSAGTFRQALAAGAHAYLLKHETRSPELVVEAIRAVADGRTYFQSEATRMLEELARSPGGRPFNLTPRELEILGLLAGGRSNRAIATELSITEQAVKNHLRRMYPKLGVKNRTAAALLAEREGISSA